MKLFEVCQETSDFPAATIVLESLAQNLKHRSTHVRETTLVTFGDLGRFATVKNPLPMFDCVLSSAAGGNAVREVCFNLICALGDLNPVLRGVAFLQVCALSSYLRALTHACHS